MLQCFKLWPVYALLLDDSDDLPASNLEDTLHRVLFLKFNNPATAQYPNDGSRSIMALIGF